MTARRVAVVASEILGVPGTGGPGTADSLLAAALGQNGYDVRLLVAPGRRVGDLSPEWRQIYEDAGVRVRPLEAGSVRPAFLTPTAAVLAALRDDPPDVVIADDWRGLAYAALRLRQTGRGFPETAFVVYCHGPARVLAEAARKVPDTLGRCGEEVAERACLELADAVVSPSAWLLQWMRDHGWRVPSSARVVQNLWQSTALSTPAERPPAAEPVRRLVFFGQLREGKGVALFIDALRRLHGGRLAGKELLFVGRETPRWTSVRVREELGPDVAARAAEIRFEPRLERAAALQELLRPGTLVVLPSLLENSPYAVAECVEHEIPFVAARVGGVPELIREEDHARVLFEPTADGLLTALERVLAGGTFEAARPARPPEESLASWLELVDSVAPSRVAPGPPIRRVAMVASGDGATARARTLAERSRTVEVEVVSAASRREGIAQTAAEWVLFVDDDDVPDADAVDALVAAQAATQADAVTPAVRPADAPQAEQLFLGDPGALGLIENHYGVLALVRRAAISDGPADDSGDPDWPLLARLALRGGRVVSVPEALSVHHGRPGRVTDVPGAGLAVLEAFERHGDARRDLAQLAAAAAAALARLEERSASAHPAVLRVSRAARLRAALGRARARLRHRRGAR